METVVISCKCVSSSLHPYNSIPIIKLEGNIWRFLFPWCFIETIYFRKWNLLVVVQSKHSVVVAKNWTTCSFLTKWLGNCTFFGHRSLIRLTPNAVVSIPVNFVESSVFLLWSVKKFSVTIHNILQCLSQIQFHNNVNIKDSHNQCSFSQSSLKANEKTTKQQYNIKPDVPSLPGKLAWRRAPQTNHH